MGREINQRTVVYGQKPAGIVDGLFIDGALIPVVIDPNLPNYRGVCEWHLDFEGRQTTPKRIVMREWDERVLLHEALHCLLGDNEDIVRRATQIHEAGWRYAE